MFDLQATTDYHRINLRKVSGLSMLIAALVFSLPENLSIIRQSLQSNNLCHCCQSREEIDGE